MPTDTDSHTDTGAYTDADGYRYAQLRLHPR